MVKIKLKFWDNLFIILLLLLFSPLFFFKLGQSSLVSFDEAWYGDIARNMLNSGDPINLIWNGSSYIDHPPAGFWFLAISELIFGVNELGVRFAPAFLGLLSAVLLYLFGKELFGRVVGFASAIALPSSFWFLFRARSGNLDVILTFFFLLTIYLATKAVSEKKFLLPWSAALAFLVLTKTLVPLAIIPSLIIIFWKTKYSYKEFFGPGVLFILIVGGWLINQLIHSPNFLSHYLGIGLPGVDAKTDFLANFLLIKEYLHSGIGKWFWPGIASIFFGLFLRKKSFFILAAFFFAFLIPSVFSHKVHIWHLIPLHPILILAFFGFTFVLLVEKFKINKFVVTVALLGISIYFSGMQIRQAWFEFIDLPAYVSDEAILSKEASKYSHPFYIDGDFQQSAIFYSGKVVKKLSHDEILAKFAGDEKFLLLTKENGLELVKEYKDKYQILKTDRDKFLILKN